MAALCRKLGVSRSGFYARKRRPRSQRQRENEVLLAEMVQIHRESRQTYGSPRIHAELKERGYRCGRHRVARLMRENGIEAKMRRRFIANPGRHEFYEGTGNQLLARGPVSLVNEVWVGDLTYIKTHRSWIYLATVMDLYSRRIIGWSVSKRRTSSLAKDAVQMALQHRKPKPGTLFHSDQGIEYAAHSFRALLDSHGIRRSMSRQGNCYDNAYAESFFHSLKTEMVYFSRFRSGAEAVAHIMDYISFYNTKRRHSSLGYQSPVDYEKLAA